MSDEYSIVNKGQAGSSAHSEGSNRELSDPYWHPDNKNTEDMSSERRNRNIALGALAVAIIVIFVCVILLIVAYVNLKQAQSCSCPSTQSYYISGYDPGMMWTQNLSNPKTTNFATAASNERKTLIGKLGSYTWYQVKVTAFANPAFSNPSTVVQGVLFYGVVTLQGQPSALPSLSALQNQLKGSSLVDIRNIFATSSWTIFAVTTQPTALCSAPYYPATFTPQPYTTIAQTGTGQPGSSVIPPGSTATGGPSAPSSAPASTKAPPTSQTAVPSSGSTAAPPTGPRSTAVSGLTTTKSPNNPTSGSIAPTTPNPQIDTLVADVAIILDVSNTQGSSQAQKKLLYFSQFLTVLGLEFHVSPTLQRLGLVTYAGTANPQQFCTAVNLCWNATYISGSVDTTRNLGSALAAAAQLKWRNSAAGLKKLAVIVSDGISFGSPQELVAASSGLTNQGVAIAAIAVGLGPYQQLSKIVSVQNNIAQAPHVNNVIPMYKLVLNWARSPFAPLIPTAAPPYTGTKPPRPTQPPVALCTADAVFILDRSQSITEINFPKVKAFVNNVASQLVTQFHTTIGGAGVRLALVAFNDYAQIMCYFNQSISLAQFQSCVAGTNYFPGLTNTGDALNKTYNLVLQPGSGDRPMVPDVVVLITDGLPTLGTADPVPIAAKIRANANTTIAAIGVNGLNGANKVPFYQNLLNITGNPNNIFNVTNFNELNSILSHTLNLFKCSSPCYPDVSFLMETSELVGQNNFIATKANILSITNMFAKSGSLAYTGQTQLGLAHFSTPGYKSGISLNITRWTVPQIQTALNQMVWDDNNVTGLSDLSLGLEYAQSMFQNAQPRNQIQYHNRFLILYAQGFMDPQFSPPFLPIAQMLRNQMNVTIFGVRNGPRGNDSVMAQITGDPHLVYHLGIPPTTPNLDSIIYSQILKMMGNTSCSLPPLPECDRMRDVFILLHQTVSCTNFNIMKNFTQYIANIWPLYDGNARIGVGWFTEDINDYFPLTRYTTIADVKDAISTITCLNTSVVNAGANLGLALFNTMETIYAPAYDRPTAGNLVIVLTDQLFDNNTHGIGPIAAADMFRAQKQARIIMVDVNPTNATLLYAIANGSQNVINVTNVNNLSPNSPYARGYYQKILDLSCPSFPTPTPPATPSPPTSPGPTHCTLVCSPGTAAPTTTSMAPTSPNPFAALVIDLIIAVDVSASLTQAGFNATKQFLLSFVSRYTYGKSGTQVGVMLYSNNASVRFYLNSFSSEYVIYMNLMKLTYNPAASASRNFNQALTFLHDNFVASTRPDGKPSGFRGNVPNYIVFTAAGPDSGPDPTLNVQHLLGMGINIFTIGLGSTVKNSDLQRVSGTAINVFQLGDNYYSTLAYQMASTIQTKTLNGESFPLNTLTFDLIIAADMSSSLGPIGFSAVQTFLTAFLGPLTINQNIARVSLVTYATSANTNFQLSTFSNTSAVQAYISGLTFQDTSKNRNIAGALQTIQANLANSKGGYRPNVPNVLLVLTTGSFTGTDPSSAATALRNNGITIFAAGLGGNTPQSLLVSLSGAAARTYQLPNYQMTIQTSFVQTMWQNARTTVINYLGNTTTTTNTLPASTTPTMKPMTSSTAPPPPVNCNASSLVMDIGLMIDSSTGITNDEYLILLNYLSVNFAPSISISQNASRVAVFTYSNFLNTANTLFMGTTLVDVQNFLLGQKYSHSSIPLGIYIGRAMSQNFNTWSATSFGNRMNAPDILFIFASQNDATSDSQSAIAQAQTYRNAGIHVVLIAVGPNPTISQLGQLAWIKSAPWVISINNATDYAGLTAQMQKAMCAVPIKLTIDQHEASIQQQPQPEQQTKHRFQNIRRPRRDINSLGPDDGSDSIIPPVVAPGVPFRAGGCQPGFTGQFCETALCTQKGFIAPESCNTGFGCVIDRDVEPICQASQAIAVDSHITMLYVVIDSQSKSYPSINLINPSGNLQANYSVYLNNSAQLVLKVVNPTPGQWLATFNSPNPCMFVSLGYTRLAVSVGFVTGTNAVHSDTVSYVIYEGQPNYFVAHAQGLPCPGTIQFLEIYENTQLIYAMPAQTRFACAYEKYFGLIYCNAVSKYYYKVFGIDENGYRFQRTDTMRCLAPSNSSTTTQPPITPSTTPKPGICLNGGTYINGMCFCTNVWTGQYCQISLCLNEGNLVNNVCQCANGYSGPHCTQIACSNHPALLFNANQQTLAIIISIKYSMAQDWQGVINGVQVILNNFLKNNPGALKNYVLTAIIDNQIGSRNYKDPTAFFTALNKLKTQSFVNCSQPILQGILQTLPNVARRSSLYIFADSPAQDYSQIQSVMHLNSYLLTQIYFIISDPSGFGKCQLPNGNSPGLAVYSQLAQFSQGHYISVKKGSVGNVFQNLFLSFYGTDTIVLGDYSQCSSQPSFTSFFADSQTSQIVISATGSARGATVSVTDPTGKTMQLSPSYAAGNLALYTMNSVPGPFIFNLTAGGSCSYRIRGVTQLVMYPGWSPSMNTDMQDFQPVFKSPTALVAHFNNFTTLGNAGVSSEVMIYNTAGQFQYISTGQVRSSSCQYQLYFDNWMCMTPNQMFYATVYTSDVKGYAVQRSFTGFCSGSPITPTSPTTCQNGGVFYGGRCVCSAYWTSQFCQTAQCLNGGTSVGATCVCMPGFTGPHCSQDFCANPNPNVNEGPYGSSLALVIQNTPSMAYDIQQIKMEINFLMHQIVLQSPQWIAHYTLITFTDSVVITNEYTTNQTVFINAVNGLQTSSQPQQQCPTLINTAIQAALKEAAPYGLVYVFTDSTFGDPGITGAVYKQLEQTKASVSFVLTNLNPCGIPFNNSLVNAYVLLSRFSDGQIFAVTRPDVTSIIGYIPTLFQSNLVYENGASNCNTAQTWYFPVDSHTKGFTVTATGIQPQLTLYSPDQKVYPGAYPLVQSPFAVVSHVTYRQGLNTSAPNLVPGIWKATIQNQPIPGLSTSCVIQVRAQSTIQMYYGFTTDIHSDFPGPEPVQANGFSNSMVAHIPLLPPSATLEYMNIFSLNYNLLGSAMFNRRLNCHYEFYSQPFSCATDGFAIVASGYDEKGYAYNRIRTAICVSGNQNCLNGGVYYKGQCVCAALFTGPFCGTPTCLNGGTSFGTSCVCPTGFTGVHCETNTCTKKQIRKFTPGSRSLVFVVDTTDSNAYILSQLKQNVQGWLQNLVTQNPMWFYNYILIPYSDPASGSPVGTVTNTQSVAAFASALSALTTSNGEDCPNPALHGIQTALSIINRYSQVYVFTPSTAKDANLTQALIPQIAALQAQINFVIPTTAPCEGITSPGGQAYVNLASASLGNIFFAAPTTTVKFLNYINTQYDSGILSVWGKPSGCTVSAPIHVYLPVDSHAVAMTLTMSGSQPTFTLMTPSGTIFTSYQTELNDASTVIITVKSPAPGTWQLIQYNGAEGPHVQASGCGTQVTLQSRLQVYLGWVNSLHSDMPSNSPIAQSTSNYAVVHQDNNFGAVEYLQIYSGSSGNNQLLKSSRFMQRSNSTCLWTWYAQSIGCPGPQFVSVVKGTDEMGYPFQRIFITQCPGAPPMTTLATSPPMSTNPAISTKTVPATTQVATTTTTPAPVATTTTTPPPSCNLTQQKYDIALVIDSSTNLATSDFIAIKSFLGNFVQLFSVPTTQFGLVIYYSFAMEIAPYSQFTNSQAVASFINLVVNQGSNSYQNVNDALFTVQKMMSGPGFRPSAKHLTILFTSAQYSGANPAPLAQQLRSSGESIIAVGYGSKAPSQAQLGQIAGIGCAISAANPSQLNSTVLPFLQRKICSATFC